MGIKESRTAIRVGIVLVALAIVGAVAASESGGPQSRAVGTSRLYFESNRGQTDAAVELLSRSAAYNLLLKQGEAELDLGEATVAVRFLGSDPTVHPTGIDALPGRSNYFIGADPEDWLTDIPHFARVRYERIYPGIDLVFYGVGGEIEYDFVLAPSADPNRIRLAFDGAERLEIDASGDLLLHAQRGLVRMRAPFVYQRVDGADRRVDATYILAGNNQVEFRVAAYDVSRSLVIDPVLGYSSYLGGSDVDAGRGIAVDAAGQAYVVGQTRSLDLPGMQGVPGGGDDVFVSKISASGSAVIYTTYLGGSGPDIGRSVDVDANGNVYVTGETSSTNFPTMNAIQPTYGGDGCPPASGFECTDAFVAKLSPTGNVLYSTYLGGFSFDAGNGIAVDPAGNTWVAGWTSSPNFLLVNPLQGSQAPGASASAFVTKLNPVGNVVGYSTFLGGSASTHANGIAVDSSGSAYIAGLTNGINFPVVQPFQTELGGSFDGFVAKIDPAGSAVEYATYFGGSSFEEITSLALDGDGNVYLTGQTASTDFPLQNPIDDSLGDSGDAFVTKLDAAGAALVYSTYLGGANSFSDHGHGIAVDPGGNAFVTGETSSSDFPQVDRIAGPCTGGSFADVFITKIDAAGSAIEFSSCFGGAAPDDDVGWGIALDAVGNAYLTGFTSSGDYPLELPFQSTLASSFDGFVTKVGDASIPVPAVSGPGAAALVLAMLVLSATRLRRRRQGAASVLPPTDNSPPRRRSRDRADRPA